MTTLARIVPLAEVTYRATLPDGSEAELRLRLPAAEATAADGWARLAARFPGVDPRTVEIEIRESTPPRRGPVAPPAPGAWLARRRALPA